MRFSLQTWFDCHFYLVAFGMDPAIVDAVSRGNPVVFFDISLAGNPAGRIKIELFAGKLESFSRRKLNSLQLIEYPAYNNIQVMRNNTLF